MSFTRTKKELEYSPQQQVCPQERQAKDTRFGELIQHLRAVLAVVFLPLWIGLAKFSGGLFLREACLAGILFCTLLMLATAPSAFRTR